MEVVNRFGCVMAVGPRIDKACWLNSEEDMQRAGITPEMIKQRQIRDNSKGKNYSSGLHVTLISKAEMNTLNQAERSRVLERFSTECLEDLGMVALGVGGASDKDSNKTRFVVLVWPSANEVRGSFGLGRKDFHITLGFSEQDVHGCPKSSSSLLKNCNHGLTAEQVADLTDKAERYATNDADKAAIFEAVVFHYRHDTLDSSMDEVAIVKALIGLAILAGRRNSFSEAAQLAHEALSIRKTPRALLILGDALKQEGDIESSLTAYSEASELCVAPKLWPMRTKVFARSSKLKEGMAQPVPNKFPRTPHLLNLGAATRDDLVHGREHWAPFLSQLQPNAVSVEEKIDGANLGVWCDESWQLVTKNRSHFVCSDSGSQWTGLDVWLDAHRVQLCDILGQRFVLYGEWMYARHSVEYDSLPALFVAFDLYDRTAGRFLSAASRDSILSGSGIPIVPTIKHGAFAGADAMESDLRTLVAEHRSTYRSNGTMEGVVVRCDEPIQEAPGVITYQLGRLKLVRADFIQGIDQHWTKGPLVRNSIKPAAYTATASGQNETAVKGAVKYPSTPHLPFSPCVHSDDIVGSNFSNLCGPDAERVVVTEKLDGGNCCLRDGMVFGRTHGHEATHWSFGAVKQLYMMLRMTHYELFQVEFPGLELYGENMSAIHSITYDMLCSPFYLFAAACRNEEGERVWLSWDEVSNIANTLGIPTVPVVFDGCFKTAEQLEQLLKAEAAQFSRASTEIAGEGFVVRVARAFNQAEFDRCIHKYVRENHVQTGANWKNTCVKATMNCTLEEMHRAIRPPTSSQPLQLYVDLDGTLADFDKRVLEITGKMPEALPCAQMWRCIQGAPDFFGTLEWMPGAKQFWDEHLAPLNPTILSGVPQGDSRWAQKQKLAWCVRNLGPNVPVVLCATRNKNRYSGPGTVLIDDRARTKRPWEEKGGVFIHHTSVHESQVQLEKLMAAANTDDAVEPEPENKKGSKKTKKMKAATASTNKKANARPRNPKFSLICLVGFPGSGKSTFAQALCERYNCTRVCQDELGSRGACEDLVGRSIKKSAVVVDRCNVTRDERKNWLGLSMVDSSKACIVHFRAGPEECASRIIERTNHKTIGTTNMASALKIVQSFNKRLQVPDAAAERYSKVFTVDSFQEADALLGKLF